MATQIEWKKGLFSDNYSLFSLGVKIGELKNKSLSGKGLGELRGRQFDFKTAGIFKQNTWISNRAEDGVLANIKYDPWRTKAEIVYLGKKYIWKSESAWNNTMSISCDGQVLLKMSGSTTKGLIEIYDNEDEMLVLACLFLTNYYWQVFAIVMLTLATTSITNLTHIFSR